MASRGPVHRLLAELTNTCFSPRNWASAKMSWPQRSAKRLSLYLDLFGFYEQYADFGDDARTLLESYAAGFRSAVL